MSWLLDTCALSDVARGDPPTLARLRATLPRDIAVSAVSVHEVEFGLQRLPPAARRVEAPMRDLLGAVRIHAFTAEDARASASLRAALARAGRPIGAYDVLIAGTALSRGLTLVTSNVKEFARVSGLRLENWRLSK